MPDGREEGREEAGQMLPQTDDSGSTAVMPLSLDVIRMDEAQKLTGQPVSSLPSYGKRYR